MKLWKEYSDWEKNCYWVELSHELSEDTPHWSEFPTLKRETFFDLGATGFGVEMTSFVGQYGTHVDAPVHFVKGADSLEVFTPKDLVMPLCVIDKSQDVAENPDYTLTVADIEAWEKVHGEIPEGAFIAFRSDWSKLGTSAAMDNADSQGKKHYPGWTLDAIKFLVEERNIGSIGHETSDTDSAVSADTVGYLCEYYILDQHRYQIELLANLDKCPPTGALIFCTFPKFKNGTGFPARCFALCPNVTESKDDIEYKINLSHNR